MKLRYLFFVTIFFLLVCAFSGVNRSLPGQSLSSPPEELSKLKTQTLARYRIDPGRSQFMVHAFRGGVLYFKGHDHFIKVGDFSGEVELMPDVINPAALRMTIKSDSLEETGADFTAEQKQIIKKELDGIVLESARYPEITFQSTGVRGQLNGGRFEAKIEGDISLHGITKRITIPADVSFEGGDLRSKGEFELDRKDFNVNATNAFHGTVRVRHKLKFTFDIVAHKV